MRDNEFDTSIELEEIRKLLFDEEKPVEVAPIYKDTPKEVLELVEPDGSIMQAEVLDEIIPIVFGATFSTCDFTCPSCASPLTGYTANTLTQFYREVIEGDFVVAGVGTRGLDNGNINITLPAGSQVKDAWLYWNTLATEAVDASEISLNFEPVTGEVIGVIGNTCWPCNCNFPGCPPAPSTVYGCPPEPWVQLKNTIYRADVGPNGANIVNGNASESYTVTDIPFTPGMETCDTCSDQPKFPGCCGSQGACLFVTYEWNSSGDGPSDPAKRFREVTIYDGGVHLRPNDQTCYPGPWTQNYNLTHTTDYNLFARIALAAGDAQSTYADSASFNDLSLNQGDPSYFNPTAGLLMHVKTHGYNGDGPMIQGSQHNYIKAETNVDCVSWFLYAFSGGDPHFYGFEGDRFTVNGEIDKCYNLLSDSNVQINSYFRKWTGDVDDDWTSMGQIALKIGKNGVQTRILIDADAGAWINGAELTGKAWFKTGQGNYTGSVEEMDEFLDELSPTKEYEGFGRFVKGWMVTTDSYKFIIAVCTDDHHGYYLNFIPMISNYDVRPHGIVGQTADFDGKARISTGKQGEGAIDGVYSDYEVSNIWADDFKYNRFNGKGMKWI